MAAVVCVAAAVLGAFAIKFLDRLRRRDAETEAKEILEKAKLEASNHRREADLEMKEAAIKRKASGENELAKARQEFHERERSLDKRQDAVEQQAEQVR